MAPPRVLLRSRAALGVFAGVAALGSACRAVLGIGDLPPLPGDDGGPPDANVTDAAPPADACTNGCCPCVGSACNAVVKVAAGGGAHACALLRGGDVWCWGANAMGEIGCDPESCGVVRAPYKSFTCAADIAAGAVARAGAGGFVCARRVDNAVWCWGANDHGQLGHDPGTDTVSTSGVALDPTPSRVASLPDVSGIAAGAGVMCAWTLDGAAYCWGDNAFGELDQVLDAGPFSFVPLLANGISGVTSVGPSMDFGSQSLCALTGQGDVYCWGDNARQQRGARVVTGSPANRVAVPTSRQVIVGHYASCSLAATQLYCWGNNGGGLFGNGVIDTGDAAPQAQPPRAGGAAYDWSQISGAYGYTCAIEQSTRNVFCWGVQHFGDLGNGFFADGGGALPCPLGFCQPTPAQVAPGFTATQVAVSADLTVAIGVDGKVYAWGLDSSNSLGPDASDVEACDNTSTCRPMPALVQGLP